MMLSRVLINFIEGLNETISSFVQPFYDFVCAKCKTPTLHHDSWLLTMVEIALLVRTDVIAATHLICKIKFKFVDKSKKVR